jgi:transcriptional regulator with XRE-family HTH domain
MEAKKIKQMFSDDPQVVVSWCKQYNITHQELADRAGITPAYFSMIVSEKRPFVEPSKKKVWMALIELANEREAARETSLSPDSLSLTYMLNLYKSPEELTQEKIELLEAERDNLKAQVGTLQKLVVTHEARTNWNDVNKVMWARLQEFEEMMPQLVEFLNKLTNDPVYGPDARTLATELIARFPKTIMVKPEEAES